MKKSTSKTSLAFFSEHSFQSEKMELLPPISSYNRYFFRFKDLNESKLLSERIFIVGSWTEKTGIHCRLTTIFILFLIPIY
jgi:hypothetical protein